MYIFPILLLFHTARAKIFVAERDAQYGVSNRSYLFNRSREQVPSRQGENFFQGVIDASYEAISETTGTTPPDGPSTLFVSD